jgi:hypothetical protein
VLQQQLTTLDFVSYCGGSLGLFLGFSALSAVEIIYYLTIRWMCLKSRKRVEPEQVEDRRPRNYLIEFMENSSIHGFNQTAKGKRHFTERFSSSISSSGCCCKAMIRKILDTLSVFVRRTHTHKFKDVYIFENFELSSI